MKNIKFVRRINRILLISLLFFSFFSLSPLQPLAGKESHVSVKTVFKLEKVRKDLAPHIKTGDMVIEAVGKRELGRIAEIYSEPYFTEVYSHNDKKFVLSELEDFSNVFVILYSDGTVDDGSVSINGYALKMGKEIPLRLPDFYGVSRCVEITPRGADGRES